jgi:hypothetical protein
MSTFECTHKHYEQKIYRMPQSAYDHDGLNYMHMLTDIKAWHDEYQYDGND